MSVSVCIYASICVFVRGSRSLDPFLVSFLNGRTESRVLAGGSGFVERHRVHSRLRIGAKYDWFHVRV